MNESSDVKEAPVLDEREPATAFMLRVGESMLEISKDMRGRKEVSIKVTGRPEDEIAGMIDYYENNGMTVRRDTMPERNGGDTYLFLRWAPDVELE